MLEEEESLEQQDSVEQQEKESLEQQEEESLPHDGDFTASHATLRSGLLRGDGLRQAQ